MRSLIFIGVCCVLGACNESTNSSGSEPQPADATSLDTAVADVPVTRDDVVEDVTGDASVDVLVDTVDVPDEVHQEVLEETTDTAADLQEDLEAEDGPDTDGNNQCDVDVGLWKTPTWNELEFAPEVQQPFVFETELLATDQVGVSRYAIRAYADLDCDTVMSTFAWFAQGLQLEPDAECTAAPIPGFFSRNEGE
jgi:hypothetical protein